MGKMDTHIAVENPTLPKRKYKGKLTSKDGEASLWVSVVMRLVYDLCSVNYSTKAERENAERWVGDYPDANFSYVISLAGFDPKTAWVALNKIAKSDYEGRKRYIKQINKFLKKGVNNA
jgi:hypothetical protein